jgi:hypothetical protein
MEIYEKDKKGRKTRRKDRKIARNRVLTSS